MSKIYFKNLVIEHIVKPSLKNSSITIQSSDTIILKTPHVSDDYIESLLNTKHRWIEKQLEKLELCKPKKINLGDEVLLFGEIYSIDSDEVTILRKKLHRVKSYTQDNILRCYDEFYKEYMELYIPSLLKQYAQMMHVEFSEVKFRKMKRRWGSCSSKKVITLNTQLLQLEKELIEYVLVHELAHLVHMNHSKAFHQLVEKYLMNSNLLRKELKHIAIVN